MGAAAAMHTSGRASKLMSGPEGNVLLLTPDLSQPRGGRLGDARMSWPSAKSHWASRPTSAAAPGGARRTHLPQSETAALESPLVDRCELTELPIESCGCARHRNSPGFNVKHEAGRTRRSLACPHPSRRRPVEPCAGRTRPSGGLLAPHGDRGLPEAGRLELLPAGRRSLHPSASRALLLHL